MVPAETTPSNLRISKTTLQEENDIKDAIAASSDKPELDFRPKIHRQLQATPRQYFRGKRRPKMPPLSTPTPCRERFSSATRTQQHHRPNRKR
jgi:hypothetical protein